MDNPDLGSDESIIKKIPRIIIRGVRHEADLTGKRIILRETETGTVHYEIGYPEIILAFQGMNALREPTISITYTPAGKEKITEELIFVHQPGGLNIQACDACMDILKEHGVPVRKTTLLATTDAQNRIDRVYSGVPGGTASAGRQSVPDYSILGTSYSQKQKPSDEPGGLLSSPLSKVAVVIAVLVVIAGIIIAGQAFAPKNPQPEQFIPAVIITPTPTEAAPATLSIIVSAIPTPVLPSGPASVPDNGTWVRISFPGNYTGNLKAAGWQVEVNSSGTSDYLLPVRDAMIEGQIGKSEGDGGRMTVGIYYYGRLISETDTTKPYGVVDLHVDIQQAVAATPTPTPSPAPVVVSLSGDLTVPPAIAPANGVWARVFYPGNYVGYFSANGRNREVNTTGDQFFQLSMTSGSIDGTMEKQDYSGRNMAVQIYKDGALVSTVNTTAPHGNIDLHATV
jgi:hypothetical protein